MYVEIRSAGVILTNYVTDEDGRPLASKYLAKYRPEFLDRMREVDRDQGAMKPEVVSKEDGNFAVP